MDDFTIVETTEDGAPAALMQVVDGVSSLVLVRGMMTPEQCRRAAEEFAESTLLEQRSDVPAMTVGAHHYNRSFDEYIAEVKTSHARVRYLLDVCGNPVERLLASLGTYLRTRHQTLRLAAWRGESAALARFTAWNGGDGFLLAPHEDIGQLHARKQADFEVQQARERGVAALNWYPVVPRRGGRLRIWNLVPDAEMRHRYGLDESGYPYPPEILDGIPHLDTPISTGDLLVFNGGFVHAVTSIEAAGAAPVARLAINLFVGRVDDTTMVHWV